MNKPFYGAAFMPKSERSSIINDAIVPGPGAYDYNKERQHNELPKWSLKKRLEHGSCFEKLSKTPGPGGYKIETCFKKQAESKITTKGEKYKHFVEKSYSHSPLNIPGSLNIKGGHSFGYRQAFKELQKSPGPIYHLDKIVEEKRLQIQQDSYRGFGFGQRNNIYKKNDQSPGPGSFQTGNQGMWKSKTCESWTFGTGQRNLQQMKNALGPGEYDPKIIAMTRTFKLRGKNQIKQAETNNTGPGSYDIPDTKTKIGTRFNARKTQLHSADKQNKNEVNLSPFSYNPPRYLDKMDNTNGFSLGKRLDEIRDDEIEYPGPGAYQIAHQEIKNSGGYMGRKMEQKKKESAMDNFYKYDPKVDTITRQSPKFSFPQGKRSSDKQNGHSLSQQFYQTIETKKSGYSYSMGTSKRFADLKKESGPFKQSQQQYSTIGQLPSYMKKSLKKKE